MGLFDRFKQGLAKTREKIGRSFRSILPFGRKIDDAIIDQLEETMLADDMGPAVTARLVDEVRRAYKSGEIHETQEIIPFLQKKIVGYWPEADRRLNFAESGPTVILVVGINGSGKTTSVAKLCHYLHGQGKKVILAAGDTFRAAAVAQLTEWANRLGVQIVKHDQGADPGAVAYDGCEAAVARQADVLIIDTAGRLHTQDHLMRELNKIQRVVEKKIPGAPHEVLLVLDSTIGQNAINQARIFSQTVKVTGLFLAKLDGSAKGGIVVGIHDQINIPVKFVGLGEKPTDIEPFDPETFVQALFSDGAAS
ncbi:MAG TPA: signal recognition particle-docking protein FtsY [Phycisphaerae bacterium]|nr:signal recognition particle-docking protein FtsY [Phycisphaerae bacterium]HOJ74013.1 signal recognition particle-docking protein FtsY [Phycisphaerae bacterium]HOM50608.1 signal recognition particle-docking protein FtsY [Phycisphaerae bacterium]HON66203.1 signal recognition particle-docking protein FtsY [Phycisphaerae bacterium]HOQ87539.1 signal recognition particle-docking protein FtsY [Phycisphaerae bacterium]